MQNIKLEIEYDGTNFYGWEIQKDKPTLRGVIETTLSSLFQEKIKLTCAARTDAGVHAISQIANFKATKKISPLRIKKALLQLPPDIYVKNVSYIPLYFDARRNARSRTYIYKIILGKSPLLRLKTWEYTFPLDIDKIKEALHLFIGTYRFDSFACKDSGVCEVKNFTLLTSPLQPAPCTLHSLIPHPSSLAPPILTFEICANRFLRHMVRLIIGTLTELGRGKIQQDDIKNALLSPPRVDTGPLTRICAPPQGLYLKQIKY